MYYWLCYGIGHAPTGFNSVGNGFRIYPRQFGPLGKGQAQSKMLNMATTSAVSALRFLCGPLTVFWRVWAIVINSFNGVFCGWSWPHVCKKVFKRVSPLFTHNNSASAVVFPSGIFGVAAPSFHAAPNVPFGRNCSLSSHAMSRFYFAQNLNPEASTTNAGAVSQSASVYVGNVSAVTNARPKATTIAASNNPSSKAPACHFNEFWHDVKFTTFIGEM